MTYIVIVQYSSTQY